MHKGSQNHSISWLLFPDNNHQRRYNTYSAKTLMLNYCLNIKNKPDRFDFPSTLIKKNFTP
jgi:hypothetical protein